MILRQDAYKMIDELEQYALENGRLEGTWHMYMGHVENVAKAASIIAKEIGLDSEKAYVMGLLHDIGKIEETLSGRFHGIVGYEMLKEKDEEIARIALLHMFSSNNVSSFDKVKNLFNDNQEDYEFVVDFSKKNPPDDYDLLIQLADSIATHEGLVSIEERRKEYSVRHNQNLSDEEVIERIRPRLEIKQYFDRKINGDVYELLGIEKDTQKMSDILTMKNQINSRQ